MLVMLVKEAAAWDGSEIDRENQAGPHCPAGCKMRFSQSAFVAVKMSLIIGMHNILNMQIKSFKTRKEEKEELFHVKGDQGDMTFQCDVRSWIGFENRRRILEGQAAKSSSVMVLIMVLELHTMLPFREAG